MKVLMRFYKKESLFGSINKTTDKYAAHCFCKLDVSGKNYKK